MNSSIRREALKAAAKVAMSLSAVAACGGTTLTSAGTAPGESPREEAAESSDELRRADSGATNATDAGTRPSKKKDAAAPTYPVDAAVAVLDAVACNAEIDTISPDAGWDEQLPTNAGLTECCLVIVKDYNEQVTNFDGGTWPDERHRWGCCNLLTTTMPAPRPDYVMQACTPWGPPMPPSFLFETMTLAEVA